MCVCKNSISGKLFPTLSFIRFNCGHQDKDWKLQDLTFGVKIAISASKFDIKQGHDTLPTKKFD